MAWFQPEWRLNDIEAEPGRLTGYRDTIVKASMVLEPGQKVVDHLYYQKR